MDKTNKFIKLCFHFVSLPVSWIAMGLVWTNLFNFRVDYEKVKSFPFKNSEYPTTLINSLIIGEDHRFYLHKGFDPIAICRAAWKVFLQNERQGGSTIEQQLVRVLTSNYQPTVVRKIREILLASIVHLIFPKSDIPAMYLSIAYFGWQMEGVEQVFKKLNIVENKITIMDSCTIVARLKYPEIKFPSMQTNQMIFNRSLHIYDRLIKKKCITNRCSGLQGVASPFPPCSLASLGGP